MPSNDHEVPLEMFRKRPRLALDLLRTVFGIDVPDDADVSLGSETYVDVKPAEYRCDVTAMVGDAARKLLEEIVKVENYEWANDFARRHIAEGKALGRAEGEARGEAKLLLVILSRRGIDVSDEARDRITSCTDTAQLEHWAERALIARTIDEVLG